MAANCIDTLIFGQVCDNCDGGAILKVVSFSIKLFSAGVLVLAVIGIIVCGVMIISSRDDAGLVARAKKRLIGILVGVVAYAFMFTIANFVIPGGVVTSTLDSSTTSCPDKPVVVAAPVDDDPMHSNAMGDIIARAAAVSSWPIQSWQKPYDSHYGTTAHDNGKYYSDSEDGKCYYKSWVTYGGPKSDCVLNNRRITYTEAGASVNIGAYASCDRFVSITLYSLGLNDGSSSGNYPATGPTAQNRWLSGSSNWRELENRGKDMLNGTAGVEQLQPGDVFAAIQTDEGMGHVAIYVGKYGGSYGTLAEASASGKYPRITPHLDSAYVRTVNGQSMFAISNTRPYHIYRYIGPMTDAAKNSPYVYTQQSVEPAETYERQSNTYVEREGLPYLLHVPEGATSGMPLVIYMHGIGEVKSPKYLATIAPVKALEESSVSNKFIGIAPVQPDNSYSRPIVFNRTKALIDEIVEKYKINKNRIYIYGFSLGGAHTWCMVNENPNFFAAAAPISMNTANSCGGHGPSASNFMHTKVWAQCGGAEKSKISGMQNFVNQINNLGGSAKFNTIGNYDHGQTQKNADYTEILTWLLSN